MTLLIRKFFSGINDIKIKYLSVACINYCCIFMAQLKSVGEN